MKTFSQLITEIRTKFEALKAVKHIHQTQRDAQLKGVNVSQMKNTLPNKTGKYFSRDGYWQAHDHFEDPRAAGYAHRKIMSVPMDKVSSTQPMVGRADLERKIITSTNNNPKIPYFVHHAESDTFHLVDGNHKTNMRNLRGFSHVKAVVIDSKHIDKSNWAAFSRSQTKPTTNNRHVQDQAPRPVHPQVDQYMRLLGGNTAQRGIQAIRDRLRQPGKQAAQSAEGKLTPAPKKAGILTKLRMALGASR